MRLHPKLVPEIRDLPYEVRLRELGLPSLLERRVRGDMIEVFKIVNGFENIDSEQFFKRVKVRDSDRPTTRGHLRNLRSTNMDIFQE